MVSNSDNKRKICFIITSFIHYSRSFLILEELKNRSDVELHVAMAGAILLSKYASKDANIRDILKKDGIDNIHEIHFNLDGGKKITQAKTAGLGVIEFSSFFNHMKPDLIVVRGDRFEVLSAAVAAAYMNIPIAHIEGGDVSGTLDESVRHAITKLSHIHFATNEPARNRILKMGEQPEYVFNFGSPDIEVVHNIINNENGNRINLSMTGSGFDFQPEEDYLMVTYHPVTTEIDRLVENTSILLEVIHETNLPVFWFWPNFDIGSEEISHELRAFKDQVPDNKIRFMRHIHPQKFICLLKNTKCFIGNSSAGIKECSYLGIPVINLGSRQNNRFRADNVVDVGFAKEEIANALEEQLKIGRYPVSDIYKIDESPSKKIASVLAEIDLYIQKSFID
ncbi:UDP-N-acetylglucosamine 2-epimerase (hydrolyzing) [Patescibacteria group bacterium]|nr:UDP-N-acetylglucosamine 2-epimerase (hydrolyzing) [Patescibacteria group bacterium]